MLNIFDEFDEVDLRSEQLELVICKSETEVRSDVGNSIGSCSLGFILVDGLF